MTMVRVRLWESFPCQPNNPYKDYVAKGYGTKPHESSGSGIVMGSGAIFAQYGDASSAAPPRNDRHSAFRLQALSHSPKGEEP